MWMCTYLLLCLQTPRTVDDLLSISSPPSASFPDLSLHTVLTSNCPPNCPWTLHRRTRALGLAFPEVHQVTRLVLLLRLAYSQSGNSPLQATSQQCSSVTRVFQVRSPTYRSCRTQTRN
ncbi:hypothetical protein C8T65DRAFT_682490, partial [Cerioporus squamosus]